MKANCGKTARLEAEIRDRTKLKAVYRSTGGNEIKNKTIVFVNVDDWLHGKITMELEILETDNLKGCPSLLTKASTSEKLLRNPYF